MNVNKSSPFIAWQNFASQKEQINYPIWPNEVMIKVLFGDYLNHKPIFNTNMKILDVGCGFGNNLLPFLVKGYKCFGTEVTGFMARQTQRILAERGFSVRIKKGTNRKLPFAKNYFDLLLSIGVIHYEDSYEKIQKSLKEYKRVLKPTGYFFILTTGNTHEIIKKAKKIKANIYRIQNYDFRNGTCFFCFETPEFLKKILSSFFQNVEVGRVTEQLMTTKIDFLIATGSNS